MSRIGNKTITIPAGVELNIAEGNEVTVKGPKGTLSRRFDPRLEIAVDGNTVTVKRPNDEKHVKQLHVTTRALLNNMVVGVSDGFKKELVITGVGYRAAAANNELTLTIGYSHPVVIKAEEGLTIECPKPTEIHVSGIDKQRVGELAANIRAVRKPEPYKGKGIAYRDEHIRRKEGKTAASSK